MSTGILAAACMSLILSQAPNDVTYTNKRNHEIPVAIQESARSEIRDMLLYASTDHGRSWHQVGAIPSSKDRFVFYAPGDGTYWFQVAFVNRLGVQMPDDQAIMKGEPQQKMVIDTLQPVMKAFRAQRVGDDVLVSWEVQEDHPDLGPDGFRLEYQLKDSLSAAWTRIPVQAGLQGKASFRPGTNQAVNVQLTVRDLAANQSYSLAEVAGTVAAAGLINPQGGGLPAVAIGSGSPQANAVLPSLPGGLAIPKPTIDDVKKAFVPPPPSGDHKALLANPGGVFVPPPLQEITTEKVVADSRTPPPPDPVKVAPRDPQFPPVPGGIQPPGNGGILDGKALAHTTPDRKPLPMLQYVNQQLVKLQYEIKRQGPSGIGGMQVWLTKDDGETWSPFAEVKDIRNEAAHGRQERDFEFRDKHDMPFPDGVYGLILVVKNRAGLGREPRPGDAPEIRIEIDTKPPLAQLFKPVPDPQNPTQLLLKWSAQDKNLADAPIHLEYAEKREGPWQPIELNLKNTGRYANQRITGDYTWKVPPGAPVQVYLRLRVRDKAGNESVAVTTDPQFIDLIEPEGALIGVLPHPKRP
jgi:hypothetical protein